MAVEVVAVDDAVVQVSPGRAIELKLDVINTGVVVERVQMSVIGGDGAWASVNPPVVNLHPSDHREVTLDVAPPERNGPPEGPCTLRVKAFAVEANQTTICEIRLAVARSVGLELILDPPMVHGRRRSSSVLIARNVGNVGFPVWISGVDPNGHVTVTPDPHTGELQRGRDTRFDLRIRSNLPRDATHALFTVKAEAPGVTESVTGEFVRRRRHALLPVVVAVSVVIFAISAIAGVGLAVLALRSNQEARATLASEIDAGGGTGRSAGSPGGRQSKSPTGAEQATSDDLALGVPGTANGSGMDPGVGPEVRVDPPRGGAASAVSPAGTSAGSGSSGSNPLSGSTPGAGPGSSISSSPSGKPGCTASAGFIHGVYQVFTGGEADAQGFAYWHSRVAQSGKGDMLAVFVREPGPLGNFFVQEAFRRILARSGDAMGIDTWVSQIRNGSTLENAVISMLTSDEFYAAAGGTSNGWVEQVYLRAMGRVADPGGRAYWVKQLEDGASRFSVATLVVENEVAGREYRDGRVQSLYQRILGRAADSEGLSYWSARMLREGEVNVGAGLAALDEFERAAPGRFC